VAANKNIYLFAIVLAVVVNVFSWHLPFFWDTILTSTITQHFYHQGFGNFITPAEFDAGHPPLFYVYVTGFYFIFGKSLFAAHVSMLPFTILGIVSFIRILQHFTFSKKQQLIGVFFYFSIPAVIAQNMLVSYDAVLLSLYLAALAAFFNNKKWWFAIVMIAIAIISLRGLFCIISISVTIYFLLKKDFKSWLNWNLYFVPAIIIAVVWYVYHYTQTGWFLSTNASGWSNQRGFVDAIGFLKNGFSIARCFFDLGIVILTLLTLFYLVKKKKTDVFILMMLIPFVVFSVLFFPFSNPINHRYFLIVYVLMLLPVLTFLKEKKIIISVLTILILWLGNLQIYPVPISNGWDCTLQFLSYNSCMEDFYFVNNREKFIDRTKIGSVFPMLTSLYQTHLSDDTLRLINVNNRSIDSIPFILYSNVGNDFSDEQIRQLSKWDKSVKFHHGLVEMTLLYRNPKK
jgi:hypothetical protein